MIARPTKVQVVEVEAKTSVSVRMPDQYQNSRAAYTPLEKPTKMMFVRFFIPL